MPTFRPLPENQQELEQRYANASQISNSRRRELLGMSPLGCAVLDQDGGDGDGTPPCGCTTGAADGDGDDAAERARLKAQLTAERDAEDRAKLKAELLAERNAERNSRPMTATRRAELLAYSGIRA